ncbi:hypothetical protein CONLIGDRAFT_675202 [Coniochaeta ligniaria NRRL 30616]|uniref:Uncharacterized protein n=1 Tax=Coniochaeta ligniaria NRRL 30616 TaxID=1408157 RepID=A0A1J7I3U0_9PEZI|nr:hypothetical protein CONLIGDRAFT_675202 [Coniochaeta ligniaria NRRL 30616]
MAAVKAAEELATEQAHEACLTDSESGGFHLTGYESGNNEPEEFMDEQGEILTDYKSGSETQYDYQTDSESESEAQDREQTEREAEGALPAKAERKEGKTEDARQEAEEMQQENEQTKSENDDTQQQDAGRKEREAEKAQEGFAFFSEYFFRGIEMEPRRTRSSRTMSRTPRRLMIGTTRSWSRPDNDGIDRTTVPEVSFRPEPDLSKKMPEVVEREDGVKAVYIRPSLSTETKRGSCAEAEMALPVEGVDDSQHMKVSDVNPDVATTTASADDLAAATVPIDDPAVDPQAPAQLYEDRLGMLPQMTDSTEAIKCWRVLAEKDDTP